MRALHLIRRRKDAYAEAAMRGQERDGAAAVAVYLQDAVYGPFPREENAFVLEEDCRMRGVEPPLPTVDYRRLAELIFECDWTAVW